MSAIDVARQLVRLHPAHPVISVFLDLDPERFATAPARASEVTSVLDEASRAVEAEEALDHADKIGLRDDVERLRGYLNSDEPPFHGARALAVFCSGRDDLFEVVQLLRPAPRQVVIGPTAYVEPLVAGAEQRHWCVLLISAAQARIFTGVPDRLTEHERGARGDAEHHVRLVAEQVEHLWQEKRVEHLAVGGPPEVVASLEGELHADVRAVLTGGRVAVDVATATDAQVREAVAGLVEQADAERERDALNRLEARLGSGTRAAGGPVATIEALNERRVETLLFQQGLDRAGGRCPSCGLLTAETSGECPVDGTPVQRVDPLREAALESALDQDADIVIVQRYPDLGPLEGMAALLRF